MGIEQSTPNLPFSTSSAQLSPRRAVLYTRVSSEEQVDGTSLETQLLACKRKADQLNAEVIDHHEDAGKSGALYLGRPGLQAALKDLESSKADTLIIYNLSRCARDVGHQIDIKRRVKQAGGELVFCTESYADTPSGNLQMGIMSQFAEFEREIIRERTMMGGRKLAKDGIQTKTAFAPYGYHITSYKDIFEKKLPRESFGKYVVVEKEAEWVREIFNRIAQGASIREVKRWLEKNSVPTARNGRCWWPSSIRSILMNPVYKGKATFGRHQKLRDESRLGKGFKQPYAIKTVPDDECIFIDCPAIISDEIWEACQVSLKRNQEIKSGRPSRRHLLSSFLRCPKCGRGMTGHEHKRNRKSPKTGKAWKPYHERFYRCRSYSEWTAPDGNVCLTQLYKAERLDTAVTQSVQQLAHSPKVIEAAWAAYRNTLKHQPKQTDRGKLEAEMAQLEKKSQATVRAQVEGIASGADASAYKIIFAEIAERRQFLQKKLASLHTQDSLDAEKPKDKATAVALACQAVDEVLHASDDEVSTSEKHNLLATIIDSIHPVEKDKLVIHYKSSIFGAQTVQITKKVWR